MMNDASPLLYYEVCVQAKEYHEEDINSTEICHLDVIQRSGSGRF